MTNSTQTAPRARRASSTLRSPRRLVALFLMLVIALGGVFGALGTAHADEDEANSDLSFYRLSSAMTSYFSTAQAPAKEGEAEDSAAGKGFDPSWSETLQDPGSAGSFLGYLDPEFSFSPGWISSSLSNSSDSISYTSLEVRPEEGGLSYKGMSDYAYFGAALNGLGLDSVSTGLALGSFSAVGGGLVLLLFQLSYMIDIIFGGILLLMALLNPFKLFFTAVSALSPTLAAGMTGGDTSVWGPLQGLAGWISDWYGVVSNLAWTVMVPIFFGVTFFTIVMAKKGSRGSPVKKLIVRLLFIGLGLPLLGSLYTGMLSSMTDTASTSSMGSTRVVLSTYVDFEKWANNNRLAVPTGATIEYNIVSKQPTGLAETNTRETALRINKLALGLPDGLLPITMAEDSAWSSAAQGGEESFTRQDFGRVTDMLWRYMTGAKMAASTFETEAKGATTGSPIYVSNQAAVNAWFTDFADEKAVAEKGGDPNPVIKTNNGLDVTSGTDDSETEGASQKRTFRTPDGSQSCSPRIAGPGGNTMNCNLSPLAMYNYLNTDFGSTSMTMYSSGNVASEATRSIHNSVNLVGTGAMSFLYWLNTVVLLGSFVIVGLGYAFSLIIGNIRRSFQIMTAIPLATIGALAAIAKVIIYTVAMIFEVILTIFIYRFVQEFMFSLPQIIETPIYGAIKAAGNAGGAVAAVAFITAGPAIVLVITIVTLVLTIMFAVMALRLRKSVIKVVEEAVVKIVEKLIGTSSGGLGGGGGGMLPALAGGAAAGGGAALANRMMSSRGGDTTSAVSNAGGTSGGPGGISTDGGDPLLPGGGGPPGGPPGGPGMGMLPGAFSRNEVEGAVDTDGQLAIEGGTAGMEAQRDPETGALVMAPMGGTVAEDGTTGAMGNGDPGQGMSTMPDGSPIDPARAELDEGDRVAAQGLSMPTGKPGQAISPNLGEKDVLDSTMDSAEATREGYAQADATRLSAVPEAAKGVGHAGIAAGRALAGDEAGAVDSAGRALQAGGSVAAKESEARQQAEDAGRAPTDAPSDGKYERQAQAAQQVSQAGGALSAASAAASGAAGGAAAGKGAAEGLSQGAEGPSSALEGRSRTPGQDSAQQGQQRSEQARQQQGADRGAQAQRTPGQQSEQQGQQTAQQRQAAQQKQQGAQTAQQKQQGAQTAQQRQAAQQKPNTQQRKPVAAQPVPVKRVVERRPAPAAPSSTRTTRGVAQPVTGRPAPQRSRSAQQPIVPVKQAVVRQPKPTGPRPTPLLRQPKPVAQRPLGQAKQVAPRPVTPAKQVVARQPKPVGRSTPVVRQARPVLTKPVVQPSPAPRSAPASQARPGKAPLPRRAAPTGSAGPAPRRGVSPQVPKLGPGKNLGGTSDTDS